MSLNFLTVGDKKKTCEPAAVENMHCINRALHFPSAKRDTSLIFQLFQCNIFSIVSTKKVDCKKHL